MTELQVEVKKHIRREVLALRNRMSPRERTQAACLLRKRICEHPWFRMSESILIFISYGSEIDTGGIIEEALKMGKKVYAPKVEGENMTFYRVVDGTQLCEGYKGIREPRGTSERYVYEPEQAEKVLMVMPGTVFDQKQNRIGYGKGFYDRFLSDKKDLQQRTIGVGFLCQLVEEIPAEEWDIKPCEVLCV